MAKKRSSSVSRRRQTTKSRQAKRTKSAKSSASRRAASRRQPARRSKRSPGIFRRGLSRDRKVDLVGLLFVGISTFTFLGLFSEDGGLVTVAWLDLLNWTFGSGMIFIPIALMSIGLWLLLRNFTHRLPKIEVEQAIGVGMLYLASLVLLHALLGVSNFAEGYAEARMGRGGGVIGAALLALSLGAVGAGGTVVVLAAWLLLGLSFSVGLSLPELFSIFLQTSRSVRSYFAPQRAPKSRAPVSPPAVKP